MYVGDDHFQRIPINTEPCPITYLTDYEGYVSEV